MAVGDKASEEMHEEMVRTAMAGMLNLTDILELVIDALDDRPLAEQELVGVGQYAFTHILAHLGNELNAVLDEQLLGKGLGDVAAIPKELAKAAADEPGDRAAIIDVARGQAEREQFAAVVDHQVEFEPIEPAH